MILSKKQEKVHHVKLSPVVTIIVRISELLISVGSILGCWILYSGVKSQASFVAFLICVPALVTGILLYGVAVIVDLKKERLM